MWNPRSLMENKRYWLALDFASISGRVSRRVGGNERQQLIKWRVRLVICGLPDLFPEWSEAQKRPALRVPPVRPSEPRHCPRHLLFVGVFFSSPNNEPTATTRTTTKTTGAGAGAAAATTATATIPTATNTTIKRASRQDDNGRPGLKQVNCQWKKKRKKNRKKKKKKKKQKTNNDEQKDLKKKPSRARAMNTGRGNEMADGGHHEIGRFFLFFLIRLEILLFLPPYPWTKDGRSSRPAMKWRKTENGGNKKQHSKFVGR